MGTGEYNFAWWVWLIWILVPAVSAYFGTYLARKGENLATKEDIGRITDEIEKVRFRYAQGLEETRQEHRLRLAAIDKRLEVHQKAFALWRQLLFSAGTDTGWETARKCEDWWYNHCLYLEPGAREAFRRACMAAARRKEFLGQQDMKLRKENHREIMAAGLEIEKSVQLPPLEYLQKGEDEKLIAVDPQEDTSIGRSRHSS